MSDINIFSFIPIPHQISTLKALQETFSCHLPDVAALQKKSSFAHRSSFNLKPDKSTRENLCRTSQGLNGFISRDIFELETT